MKNKLRRNANDMRRKSNENIVKLRLETYKSSDAVAEETLTLEAPSTEYIDSI